MVSQARRWWHDASILQEILNSDKPRSGGGAAFHTPRLCDAGVRRAGDVPGHGYRGRSRLGALPRHQRESLPRAMFAGRSNDRYESSGSGRYAFVGNSSYRSGCRAIAAVAEPSRMARGPSFRPSDLYPALPIPVLASEPSNGNAARAFSAIVLAMEIIMKKFLILVALVLVAGCATTRNGEYVKVYDRKANTWSYMAKGTDNPGAFVGTSATQNRAGRLPGEHP